MKNKAIVFKKANTAELIEERMPDPGPGDVLVRLVRSTVSSGTERANLTGVQDNATGIYSSAPDGQVTWPRRGGVQFGRDCRGCRLRCHLPEAGR